VVPVIALHHLVCGFILVDELVLHPLRTALVGLQEPVPNLGGCWRAPILYANPIAGGGLTMQDVRHTPYIER
jgi:hypothetical protein